MNINSKTASSVNFAPDCSINQLPPPLFNQIVEHVVIWEIPKLTQVCEKWRSLSIAHAAHRTTVSIRALSTLLSSFIEPGKHESKKAELEKIAECNEILACTSLRPISQLFSYRKQLLAKVMSTLPEKILDDLSILNTSSDFTKISLRASLDKAVGSANRHDRIRILTKVVQTFTQRGFSDTLKLMVDRLLDKGLCNFLELVRAYAENDQVHEILYFLQRANFLNNDDLAQAPLVFAVNGKLEALAQFLELINAEAYKDAAYCGAALGFARTGAIHEAKSYIDRISNRDYFVEKILNDLNDLPEQLADLRNLLGIKKTADT